MVCFPADLQFGTLPPFSGCPLSSRALPQLLQVLSGQMLKGVGKPNSRSAVQLGNERWQSAEPAVCAHLDLALSGITWEGGISPLPL